MKVSVILITYNHQNYIAQALDSVLAQETGFPFELIVSEDCSTDGTRALIEQYAARHPARVRLILSPRNLNTNEVFSRALAAAQGDYIATLDGDDFWTDPRKLQRQADFLDDDTAAAICFHQVDVLHPHGRFDAQPYTAREQKQVATLADLWAANFIASCSAMIRRSALSGLPAWYESCAFGDWPLYMIAAQAGHIAYIPETMAVYRYHGTGLWNRMTRAEQIRATRDFLREVLFFFGRAHAADIRRQIARTSLELVDAHIAAGDGAHARRELLLAVARHHALRCTPLAGILERARKVVHHAG
ncbi:N/A [soil metagenome]